MPTPDPNPRLTFRRLAPLPAAIATAPGIDVDQSTLVTDGTSYAWVTGADANATGVASWSPPSGLRRVTIDGLSAGMPPGLPPRVYVDGPYVLIFERPRDGDFTTAIVDTRSGAVADVNANLVDAGAGTIATQRLQPGATSIQYVAGLVRTGALPPLSC